MVITVPIVINVLIVIINVVINVISCNSESFFTLIVLPFHYAARDP